MDVCVFPCSAAKFFVPSSGVHRRLPKASCRMSQGVKISIVSGPSHCARVQKKHAQRHSKGYHRVLAMKISRNVWLMAASVLYFICRGLSARALWRTRRIAGKGNARTTLEPGSISDVARGVHLINTTYSGISNSTKATASRIVVDDDAAVAIIRNPLPAEMLQSLSPRHLILQRNVVSKNPVLELKSEARNTKQYRMSKIRIFKTKSAIPQQQTFGILVI